MKFVVTKNGKSVGKLFGSLEEAEQFAELERFADPSADVRVKSYPVLAVGEDLDPAEGQALVDAILDGADFSNLPPEHQGPKGSSAEEQGEAAPAKGSFFVRHPSKLPVGDEILENLWARDTIAIHLTWEAPDGKPPDHKEPWEKMADKHLEDLAERGGYVWAETRVRPGVAKVGRIASQRPKDVRAAWVAPKQPQHAGGGPGSEVLLRTLRLDDAKEVGIHEVTALRDVRPPMWTIQSWAAAGSRLEAMVEGVPLERTWENLTPLQQQAACAEFLRSNRKPEYPKLQFLLTPSGSKPDKVDILGMEEDGTEILARVTSHQKGSPQVGSKAYTLNKKHQRPGRRLLLFCSFFGSADPTSSAPSLFPPEPIRAPIMDGVLFVPVEEILEWVKGQSVYADKIFSL